jgi:hypothetical protein
MLKGRAKNKGISLELFGLHQSFWKIVAENVGLVSFFLSIQVITSKAFRNLRRAFGVKAKGEDVFLAAQTAEGYLLACLGLDGKSRMLLNRRTNQWLGHVTPSSDDRHLALAQQSLQAYAWLVENF